VRHPGDAGGQAALRGATGCLDRGAPCPLRRRGRRRGAVSAPQQHSMNCFHIEGHEPYTSALPPHSSVKRHIFTTPAGERDVKKSNLTETTHTPQAPCTPGLPTQTILFCVLTRAQRNARTLQPAALAFVSYWFVLVRVRVLNFWPYRESSNLARVPLPSGFSMSRSKN
jgi:hypothetical protein